jgi:lipopolysaccharide export system permease protein
MRLLDRYLLREFLVPLASCLCGFLIFWIAFDLFGELDKMQERHLQVWDILEYYVCRVPEFLPIALPAALLLAVLYAASNHARYNELTAMRAAGVSLWRLSCPYMAVGMFATIGLFVLNEVAAPQTARLADAVLSRRTQIKQVNTDQNQVQKLMVVNSRDQRWWIIGIYKEKTAEMVNPHVTWHRPDGAWLSIDADRAVRTENVWTFSGNVAQTIESNTLPLKLPKLATLSMPQFSETPDEIRSQIFISQRHDKKTRTRRADVPVREILNYMKLVPNPEIRSWLITKLQGRFAGPCACLIVILIGIPFAAAPGRRSVFVGVAASIVMFFAYYILQQVGFVLGEAGRLPPWIAAWMPNLAFGLTGLWLMLRIR